MIGGVAHESEPPVGEHHGIELVAVQHHQPAPVGGRVEGRAADFDIAEIHAAERADHLVVIARDIDDPRAALGTLEDAPDNIGVFGRPVDLLLQPPAVDDVADQIQGFAARIFQKMQQLFGTGPWRSEMRVRDPDGSEREDIFVIIKQENTLAIAL